MSINLESLNKNQEAAAIWEDGPLLVLAGPGSGKTRVLTFRVARLLEIDEECSVLALTFTTKAAAEMRNRVDELLGRRADRARLCTFHSFATDLLRQHGAHLGISPDFSLLTLDDDRLAVLDEVARAMEAAGHELPSDRKSLLQMVDRLFSDSCGADPPAPPNTPEWVAGLYSAYCSALVASNQLDFGSLLAFAQRLLHERPAVARAVRLGWTHICVDEFQDTNKAQYELLRLLAPSNTANLFVVADDDQIIYQWNGASPERLDALREDYEMRTLQLPENYRCPPEIVALANKLITHNNLRSSGKKPLVAFREVQQRDDGVRSFTFADLDEEVGFVAEDIKARALVPAECAVLARTGRLLEAAAATLTEGGIEAHLHRRKNDFFSPVIRVLFHAHRLANARHDRNVLRRLCVSWNDLADDSTEVEQVAAGAALLGGDFLRSWVDSLHRTSVSEVDDLVQRIRNSLVDRLEFPTVIEWFLEEGHKNFSDDGDEQFSDEVRTWRELHEQICRETGYEDLTLNAYLQEMDLAPKAPLPGAQAVRCMTVHGSKGLEFDHVYLIGMAQEVLPSFQALKKGPGSREVEEERRNCFVAITRVQESLTLTRSRTYNGWKKAPSQFLVEMGIQP